MKRIKHFFIALFVLGAVNVSYNANANENPPKIYFIGAPDVFASEIEYRYIKTDEVIYMFKFCPGILGLCA